MGIFATRGRSAPLAAPEARAELSGELEAAVPPGFTAVGEALASGAGTCDACVVVGQELARSGVSLDEALGRLETTFGLVTGGQPDFASARALAAGWSESTLGYLHHLGCADPVTGLASLAHLQSRLPELYGGERRGRPRAPESHTFVVVDLAPDRSDLPGPGGDLLASDLRVARVAETAGVVFPGESVCRVGRDRIVVLADRDARIGRRVAVLLQLLADQPGARAWIEGLPETDVSAAALLADLARG